MNNAVPLKHLFFLILLCSVSWLYGQNEVPNFSFETISFCPDDFFVGSGPTPAPPWEAPTHGTPDLFNSCDDGLVDVPDNFFGSQQALTGEGYAGFYGSIDGFNYREYLQAPLLNPLTAGTLYSVSFFVSLADNGCGIEKIGAYVSVDAPTSADTGPLEFTPQIESNQGYLSDTDNWTLITGCFVASGGESFITIGNFHPDSESPVDPVCGGEIAYYYLEDVSVIEGTDPVNIPLDLGGPEIACFSYEIDPGLSGYTFIWENGSHDPTLVVTESGTYILTISDGCDLGVDSIEVIISGNSDPVDVGPEEIIICAGDEYIISLDPELSSYTWQDGSSDAEYTITTTGIYSVTFDDGCSITSDQIDVTVLDPPDPISLGDDMFLCFGDEFEYSFDPDLGEFLWQDGSPSPEYFISTGGTYALTISNVCGEVSDEIVLTDLMSPEIDLGVDEVTLCEGEFIEMNIDPSLGDILWQDGSSDPIYVISSPGTFTVFITNQCGTISDQVDVLVIDPPVIDLGPDTTLCTAETILLTTTPTDGEYQWQDGATQQEYLVGSEGIYYLSISNFCGAVIDSVVVDYSAPLVDPSFGPDVSLCPGEELVLYANNPGAEFLWQDLSSGDSLLVTNSGEYALQIINACETLTDTINVAVNNAPPQLDLPDQLVLCQDATTTIVAGISGVDYLWNDGSTNAQLVVSAAGTYSVTVSSTCGTDRDTVVVIDGGFAPFVELGNDTSFCASEIISLSPANANVDAWLWHDGSTLSSYITSLPEQISVQVSNGCGTTYDTINAILLPAVPQLNLGIDTSVCPGESVILNISTPDVDILWNDGSTGTILTTSGEGLFFASITNSCGSSFDTMEVIFLSDIPVLDLGADQSLCPGEIVSIAPGIINVSYEWHDGSTDDFYNATQQETVILIISNSCGSTSDTLEVFENNLGPQVDLGLDILACDGETITIPAGVSGVDYLWQDGSISSSFVTTVSGEFIVQVSNNCGLDTDTILIDIHGTVPVVDLGSDTSLCEGVTLLLSSSAEPETFVEWQDGSSQLTYNVTTQGIYSLFESNHCGEATDTFLVSFIDAPDAFNLGQDTVLCPSELITLFAPNASFNILWQDGSTQEMIVADQETTYWLQLSNQCGLTADSLVVSIDNNIPVLNLDTEISWCEGDIVTLNATQLFNADYLWSNGSIAPSIDVSTPDNYSVIVSTFCSTVSQDVNVVPSTDCVIPEIYDELYIPNVFSPNGDGINDVFYISFGPDLDVQSMLGSFYDRWGNLVHSSSSIPFSWDGLFADQEVLPGVYVYTLKVVFIENGTERESYFSGDVTVIR